MPKKGTMGNSMVYDMVSCCNLELLLPCCCVHCCFGPRFVPFRVDGLIDARSSRRLEGRKNGETPCARAGRHCYGTLRFMGFDRDGLILKRQSRCPHWHGLRKFSKRRASSSTCAFIKETVATKQEEEGPSAFRPCNMQRNNRGCTAVVK